VGFQSTQREARASALGYSAVVRDLVGGTEKVLDVGTGRGEKLVQLAYAFGSATGIDINPEMVETARQNLPVELLAGSTFATAQLYRPACRIHLSKWCSTGTRSLTSQRSPEC
jgi:ubiquinone/menaquinone biosynthesis C-methylase UbiE